MSLCRRRFSALALGALLAPATGRAQNGATSLSVVELFTSQGCSSCPPADALMVELAGHATTLPITYPVEIWDYLGWRDTLARPAFTKRHRAYAAMVAGKRVYTPQAIVNGRGHCVGSDGRAISRLKLMPAANAAKVTLVRDGQDWAYRIALGQPANDIRLVLVPVVSRQQVQIGKGENSGRSITYANVARALVDLGPVAGAEARGILRESQVAIDGADGFALLVQSGTLEAPGIVLGAGYAGVDGVKA
ncbi:DUF1223 domain-containing protein [Rhabdaerophilum sp. SD176]|uniref:DUF1223 domain-containing protein n=1 Tax=Rhabdaerophilum sp. SD176 TaxID=2983548 RepID=UPI0024DF84E4|nr:DUF1223 domain-containing protein [Rhabdaerophilum sp. SD176]